MSDDLLTPRTFRMHPERFQELSRSLAQNSGRMIVTMLIAVVSVAIYKSGSPRDWSGSLLVLWLIVIGLSQLWILGSLFVDIDRARRAWNAFEVTFTRDAMNMKPMKYLGVPAVRVEREKIVSIHQHRGSQLAVSIPGFSFWLPRGTEDDVALEEYFCRWSGLTVEPAGTLPRSMNISLWLLLVTLVACVGSLASNWSVAVLGAMVAVVCAVSLCAIALREARNSKTKVKFVLGFALLMALIGLRLSDLLSPRPPKQFSAPHSNHDPSHQR